MERSNLILALDLSTTCTGWAVYSTETKLPVQYGILKPRVPGLTKMDKLPGTLAKMLNLAEEILKLIQTYDPRFIVIEEIAGSKNRLGQKTLDGFHWIVLFTIRDYLNRITFYDVTGADGWRTHLKLRLSDADKAQNKEAKKLNKKLAPSQRLPEVTPKTLAARHVNAKFGMVLDVDRNATDNDLADALCIGDAFIMFHFAKSQS